MESEPIVFQCDGCMAFKAHPNNPKVGECRMRAPVPVAMYWPTEPELDDAGNLRGYRMTLWPGVNATDSCCQYQPNNTTIARVEAMQAAKDGAGASKH